MVEKIPSFENMQNYKFGFGRALYNYLSTILSMPHSFKYEELDKNGVYYGLYTIIAMRVPDIKSYRSMELSGDDGGIEKELYLAAKEINAESEYELIVNKTSSLVTDSKILYPNNYAIHEFLKNYAEKVHEHSTSDIRALDSKLDILTVTDNHLSEELETKQDVTHIQNEGEPAPAEYKKGDILLFKKGDDSEVIALKICVKDSTGIYQDNDWILIPTEGSGSSAIINGKNVEGSHSGRYYSLANIYTSDTVPSVPENGDLKIEQIVEEGIKHNKLSIYNAELTVWEELIQCYSGGDFSSVLETRLSTKQNLLKDSAAGKNTAKIIVDGVPHNIINTTDDIVITTGGSGEGHAYIRVNSNEPSISDCSLGDIWLQPVIDGENYHYLIYFLTDTKGGDEEVNIEWVRLENSFDYHKNDSLKDKFSVYDNSIVQFDTRINELTSNKQNKLVDGESIKQLKVNGETTNLLGNGVITIPETGGHNPVIVRDTAPDKDSREIGDIWFKPVTGESVFEAYVLTQKDGLKNDWKRLEAQINFNHIPSLKQVLDELYDKTVVNHDAIESIRVDIDDITKNKICTNFYKTSTIKSPSCKAIADYIDSVLADLDGSEEAF